MQLENDLIGKLRPKGRGFEWNHRGAAESLGSLIQRLKEKSYIFPVSIHGATHQPAWQLKKRKTRVCFLGHFRLRNRVILPGDKLW